MLEPLSYSLDEQKGLTSAEKRLVVVETAKRLTPLGVDLLKAEFPADREESRREVWQAACEELAAASRVPWIILSAAVDYELYLAQVMTACSVGASGVAVGRAVWKEAVNLKGAEERGRFLRSIAAERLSRLSSLCRAIGRPFYEYFKASVSGDWYQTY